MDNNTNNIHSFSYLELKEYYNNVLNKSNELSNSSNDISTPIECVEEMISSIPDDFWKKKSKILDPCCGCGNFFIPIYFKLNKYHLDNDIFSNILYFNDLNTKRLNVVKNVFINDLNISSDDFLTKVYEDKYDLVVANPPYAKLMENGKRTSKNHNLIKEFIVKTLEILNPGGYLLFITPDNWMSYADRNKLITILTSLQIIKLNIHGAKKYFKSVGSTFTWYLIENTPYYKSMEISCLWKKKQYISYVESTPRKYIPLLYNKLVKSILDKTTDNERLDKFKILTSSDLHKYTKRELIRENKDETFKYKLIHTPKQVVYASRPHKYQDGYKVFISTTDKYQTFIDNCGMTQSIAFILCKNKREAELINIYLNHPLYIFINNICRWGNFNNIRILQSFPYPYIEKYNEEYVYSFFNITNDEIEFISSINM